MKAMLKQQFFALAIEHVKAGRAVYMQEEGYNLFLSYRDAVTGASHNIERVANPHNWEARTNTRERFNGWLNQIATSPEYGAIYAANIGAAQRAMDTERDAQIRRGKEKAENAINSIDNILKDLEGFEGYVSHRGDLRRLSNALKIARDHAVAVKGRV